MHNTSVYTLVNNNIKELAHRKQQKSQQVTHWLCVNVLLNNITFCNFVNNLSILGELYHIFILSVIFWVPRSCVCMFDHTSIFCVLCLYFVDNGDDHTIEWHRYMHQQHKVRLTCCNEVPAVIRNLITRQLAVFCVMQSILCRSFTTFSEAWLPTVLTSISLFVMFNSYWSRRLHL